MADKTRKATHTTAEIDAAVDMLFEMYTRDEIDGLLAQKVNASPSMGLSTNDFTDADKSKLDDLENYDDTNVKAEIAETFEQVALNRSTLGYQRKNLLMNNCKNVIKNGVTAIVNADGSITLTGSNTLGSAFVIYRNIQTGLDDQYEDNKKFLPNGKYILSGSKSGADMQVRLSDNNASEGRGVSSKNGVETEFAVTSSDNYVWARVLIVAGADFGNGVTIYPMIRYADIADDTYEPYKPSVEERLAEITDQIFGLGTQIPSGADLNDYTEAGVYCCKSINEAPTLLNNPHKTSGFRLEVSYTVRIPDRFVQKIIPNVSSGGVFYMRTYDSVGWGSWYKFSGEVVTT